MPISTSLTVKKNATAVTPTAGTDLILTPNGAKIDSGIQLHDASEVDVKNRLVATLRNRPAQFIGGARYSKWRRNISVALPKYNAATNEMEFLHFRGELEGAVSFTAAEIDNVVYIGVQLFTDSEVESFRRSGSLS